MNVRAGPLSVHEEQAVALEDWKKSTAWRTEPFAKWMKRATTIPDDAELGDGDPSRAPTK